MDKIISIATILIDPVLLAVTVIYIYGFVAQISTNPTFRYLLMGVTFGLGSIFAMLTPLEFADGVIIDMRNLLVGLSSAFFGIIGGGVTVLIAITTRILIGGDGAAPGVLGIMLAGSGGLIWAYFIRGKISNHSQESAVLGLMISAHLLAIFTLPADLIWRFWVEIAPVLVVFNLLGAILIGSLLNREEKLATKNEALLDAATTDPLTRLYNRRSAVKAYETLQELHKESHGTAMLCFDVDNFKAVNDTYGHVFGDAVLAEISSRVGSALRPADIFSRLGGDEFLIILPTVTLEETQSIAERCRAIIASETIVKDGQSAAVTISVGAEWLPDRPDFLTFVARADEALYHAKHLGRNCVALAWQGAARSAHALADRPIRKAI